MLFCGSAMVVYWVSVEGTHYRANIPGDFFLLNNFIKLFYIINAYAFNSNKYWMIICRMFALFLFKE